MESRAIFIANPAQLSVRREQLVIRQIQEITVPMEDITSLLLESQAVTISAAALYFPVLFGQGFTRDAGCLTNAALNYGYAILRGAVARNLAIHGIEPCLGIFHHSELNQFNLADDLMEPYRPLVDLYVASNAAEEYVDLTPKIKQQLFNLTNYLVRQNGKRYRLISAVGRMAESFARILAQSTGALELPELIPLELYRYE